MSADMVEVEEDFTGQITEGKVRASCAFLEAGNDQLQVLLEHRKEALTEQSNAVHVPFDNRTASF